CGGCYEKSRLWFSAAGRLREGRPVSLRPLRGLAGNEIALVRLDLGVGPVPAFIGELGAGRKFAALCPTLDRARMDAVPVGDPTLRVPTLNFGLRLHLTTLLC